LTEAPAAWRRLADALEGAPGGLTALFDDSGAAGLAWEPAQDAARWKAWAAHVGAAAACPRMGRRFWGRRRRPPPPRLAEPGAVPVPELAGLLGDFHGLCPVARTLSGPGRLELRLVEPVPWPHFARLDLAKPFAARPAYWARRLGGRGVVAVALAGGRMQLFVA
jgi:hypothetical protein